MKQENVPQTYILHKNVIPSTEAQWHINNLCISHLFKINNKYKNVSLGKHLPSFLSWKQTIVHTANVAKAKPIEFNGIITDRKAICSIVRLSKTTMTKLKSLGIDITQIHVINIGNKHQVSLSFSLTKNHSTDYIFAINYLENFISNRLDLFAEFSAFRKEL